MNNEVTALITGGAGFIGSYLSKKLLENGHKVIIYDNLSHIRSEQNLFPLRQSFSEQLTFVNGDIRDQELLEKIVSGSNVIFHFAAQTAVMKSVLNPLEDFEVNAVGTLHILEAIRKSQFPIPLIFTSTNKVYGKLDDIQLETTSNKYTPLDSQYFFGIAEDRALNFISPYGCSKGAADQYIIDYSRMYKIPTIVFRMSSIYGPFQTENEDHGWIALFIRKLLNNEKIKVYGDGKQVSDILFIDDLINAFMQVLQSIEHIQGQVFNIGGGINNSLSIIEFLDLLGQLHGKKPHVEFCDWRPGDQKYYVSNISKAGKFINWDPNISYVNGIEKMYRWIQKSI